MPEVTITTGVLATIVTAGLGGLVGGFASGYQARLPGSVLIGMIGGTALAVVLRALDVNPIIGVQSYSLVLAFAGGAATSWIVGSFS
ncbi:MAG TPA: hypothetical protein VIL12_05355 [Acidimicrobiia bacterium]